MIPDQRFVKQPKTFWAYVRTISEAVGYTVRGEGTIRVPSLSEMVEALDGRGLQGRRICAAKRRKGSSLGTTLREYFACRADTLNRCVRPSLMAVDEAERLFNGLKQALRPNCPLPMNKQKGDKKAPAFFTGIINMLIESNARGRSCEYDPRGLITVTRCGKAVRTLARRLDGAFPSTANPIAVWEIKEYYYTTTFGSRVADGVYETLLDGMELEELRINEHIHVQHYLMVDGRYTWWDCGRSYLCRMIDMLHMGYVDEILFGREVKERIPIIVKGWVDAANMRR